MLLFIFSWWWRVIVARAMNKQWGLLLWSGHAQFPNRGDRTEQDSSTECCDMSSGSSSIYRGWGKSGVMADWETNKWLYTDKTRVPLEITQRLLPGSFALGHSLQGFSLWSGKSWQWDPDFSSYHALHCPSDQLEDIGKDPHTPIRDGTTYRYQEVLRERLIKPSIFSSSPLPTESNIPGTQPALQVFLVHAFLSLKSTLSRDLTVPLVRNLCG